MATPKQPVASTSSSGRRPKASNKKGGFKGHPYIVEALKNPGSEGVACKLLGFDQKGYAFLQLDEDDAVAEHTQQMKQTTKEMYDNDSGETLRFQGTCCKPGDLFIARVPDPKEGKKFIRVQVFQTLDKSVVAYNLDTQGKCDVTFRNLYWMVRELFKIPLLTFKCSLRFLNTFAGTAAIPDAAKAKVCLSTKTFMVKFYWDKDNPQIPMAELYHNPEEYLERSWSFNMDLLSQLMAWNCGPHELEPGMILTNVRVTHALRSGHIWIQLQSGVMDTIARARPSVNLEEVITEDFQTSVDKQIESGQKIFFLRFPISPTQDKFIRVQLLGTIGDKSAGEMIVEMYDFGMKEVVQKYEMIPLEYFNSAFGDIPSQVIRADIGSIPQGGFKLNELQLLTSKTIKKKIHIDEVFLGGTEKRYPQVTVFYVPRPPVKTSTAPEMSSSVEVAKIDHIVHPFPCNKKEMLYPGLMFDYTRNLAEVRSTCKRFGFI